MQVAAVADAPDIIAGANEQRMPGPLRGRPDRVAHEQHEVGGRHRIGRRDRQLELRRGVLGVELVHLDRLRPSASNRSRQ